MEKSLIKPFIAKRVAQEFTDGMVVNLGIGLPVLCTSFLPEGIHVTVHSELGIVGQGPAPDEAHADPMHIVDAGGSASSIVLGGAFSDSSDSFGLIRGGHVDAVVLGGLEVDQEGSLANWIIPGKKMPGMGGADGSSRWCEEGHRCDGAHREGQPENPYQVPPALHGSSLRGHDRDRDGRDGCHPGGIVLRDTTPNSPWNRFRPQRKRSSSSAPT